MLSLPFPQGFVGTLGSNTGQANAIKNFATLGVTTAYFIQNSDTGAFGGTQGNDLSGTLRLVLNSGQIVNIRGAINWRITQGSTLHYFGFVPAPGSSQNIVYGNNQTHTLNDVSNYGLRKIGSTVSYADGTNVSGNAATSGLVTFLNDYLTVIRASGPKIIGPSGATGATTSTKTVDEDQTAVTTFTADKTVSWTILGGADSGAFAINAATGVLTFLTAPDYEMPTDADANGTYVVAVQATDNGGYTALQTVTVTVADLDDTPPVITGVVMASVMEGQTAVTAFTADEVVIWAISGTDGGAFAVDTSGAVTFLTAPYFDEPADANGDNVYELTITATDAAGNVFLQALTVTVTEVIVADATPPVITGPSGAGQAQTATVADGETAVTTFTADEVVAWSIDGGGDAALFAIDIGAGALSLITSANFAAPSDGDSNNVYLVTIAATDAAGNRSSQTLTVTVTALVDTTPPEISGPAGGTTDVSEGQTVVAGFAADEAVIWSINGVDAAVFSIDATGALAFVTPPDHAAPADTDGDNVYVVTVVGTDLAGNSGQQALTVTVTGLIMADTTPPAITGPSGEEGATRSALTLPEGQTDVTQFAADEPVVWSISGGPDAALFEVDAATGSLFFLQNPSHAAPQDANADNTYLVTVVAHDTSGNSSPQALTVTLTALPGTDPAPPIITGPPGALVTVLEAQTTIATFTADEPVRWAISGPDAAVLQIDAAGLVTFVTAPAHATPYDADGDNIYGVVVTATDLAGNVTEVALTVTVTPVIRPDTAPPLISGPSGDPGAPTAAVSLLEGQRGVTHLRANEHVVWSISGGPDVAMMVVNAGTGAISFTSLPDFEVPADADGDNVYVVAISAYDYAGNISTQILTVTVTDMGEADIAPPDILGQAERSITLPEGQMSVAHLRADEAVIWSMAGGPDQSALTVDPATGAVRFMRGPDFDGPADVDGDNTYVIRVTATDMAGNTSTVTLTVMVLDIDDTVVEIFDSYAADVVQIVEEVEVNHLRSSVTSLKGMTTTARDRFTAAKRMREKCGDADGPVSTATLADCSRVATRNDIPFGAHGQVQIGTGGNIAAGRFFGQTGNFAGTRRRIIDGNYAVVDNGAGITTVDITGRIARERLISERVMLGLFVGGSFAQADVSKRLTGRSDKISLSLGAYFVSELRPNIYLDGFFSVAASRNMLALRNADIRLDGKYAAQSLLMGLALSGVIVGNGYELRPEIALAYGATRIGSLRFDATVAATTEAVTATIEAVDFATLRITPELRIPVYAESDSATYIIAPSIVCDWMNGQQDCGGGLRLGLQGTSRDRRTQFDIMVEANRIGGKDRVALLAHLEHRF
jgi:hypothetical protein